MASTIAEAQLSVDKKGTHLQQTIPMMHIA